MTRETKVGLVVACSFLCLVGIVVASKWRNGDTTTKEPEQQEIRVTAGKEGQPGDPLMAPQKKDEGRAGERPSDNGGAKLPPPTNVTNPAANADPMIPVLAEAPKKLDNTPPGLPATPPPLSLAPAGSAAPGPFAGVQPIVPDPSSPGRLPSLPVPPVDANVAALPKPSDAGHERKNGGVTIPVPGGVTPLGAIEVAQGGNTKPGDPVPAFPPSPKETKPIVKDPLPTLPVTPKETTPLLGAKDPLPALPATPKETPPILGAKDPLPALPEMPKEQAPILGAKDPLPALPVTPKEQAPILGGKDPLPVFPATPKETPPLLGAKAPIPANPPPLGPAPIDANYPLPAPPPQSKNPIPQIPRESAPDLPPIVVKGVTPSPVVKETTVDEYTCQKGDSVFENLSMRFYGTAKYADALKAYNRVNSTLVSVGGSNLTIDPPVLTPGQKVLHPPKEILERDFGSSIRATAIAPPRPNPDIAPTVKIAGPTPLQQAPTPIANAAAGAIYRVRNPNGESILDIAERLLGNRSRWTAIYDLNRANPAVQPQFRIPVGTELKMPAS